MPVALSPRQFGVILYKALENTINHDGIEHAGYLSFLSVLAFFPFLVFVVALAGFIGDMEIGTRFINLLLVTLPQEVEGALKPRIDEIVSGPPQGLMTLAIVGAIWTASSMVEGVRTVLNRAYHVGTPPAYVWRRLLSIAQFLLLTVIITVVMFLLVLAPLLARGAGAYIDISPYISSIWASDMFRYALSALLLFFVVSVIYYVLPNIRQRWRLIWPGAAMTVLLWMVAAMLFSFYLTNFEQVNIIYGSLERFIVALLFFYFMNLIFIYGAEFNYLLEKAMGHIIVQKEQAPPPPPDGDEAPQS